MKNLYATEIRFKHTGSSGRSTVMGSEAGKMETTFHQSIRKLPVHRLVCVYWSYEPISLIIITGRPQRFLLSDDRHGYSGVAVS